MAKDILESLGCYSPEKLTEAERKPPEFIVSNMIPVGMSCIVGAPKTRKSFFALQMCIAIASGADFLGFQTHRCGCLYLDFEGSKSRTATRSERMRMKAPDDLLITHSNTLKIADGTLCEAIRAVHEQHPAIRVFIADTYGRCKGAYSTNGRDAYSTESDLLTPVQALAQELQVAVVFVHHARKGASSSDDIFERASGSMALTGLCDSVINLTIDGKNRADGIANLDISPRDAISTNVDISFNRQTLEWERAVNFSNDLNGMPLPSFCIAHVPETGKSPEFFSYNTAFTEAYRYPAPSDAGQKVRSVLLENTERLFLEQRIAVQCGVKSNGERGFRLMRI